MAADGDDAGRLDRPPAPDRRARLPDVLHRRFLICVDTEEEFDWRDRARWGDYGITATKAIPAAHRRFLDRGAMLSYLVDYPIADSGDAVAAIQAALAMGGAEIGAQLHPWVNPPETPIEQQAETFAGALPERIEDAKLAMLTARIERAFGQAPKAYRAGRYGVGPHSAEILLRQGYAIDLSVRALFDYSDEGGPDFLRTGAYPFWAGRDRRLLALPFGATLIGRLRRSGRGMFAATGRMGFVRGALARLGLLARIGLTPEGMPIADALEAARIMIGEGVPILNFSFHSTSLEPGHTPYVRDAADLAAVDRWWDEMLGLLDREGVRAVTCAEIIAATGAGRLDSGIGAPLSPDPRTAGPVAQW